MRKFYFASNNILRVISEPLRLHSHIYRALKISKVEYESGRAIETFAAKASRRKINLSTSRSSIRQIVLPRLTRIIDYMIQFVELINQPAGDYLLKIFSLRPLLLAHPLPVLRHSLRASRCASGRFYEPPVLARRCFV